MNDMELIGRALLAESNQHVILFEGNVNFTKTVELSESIDNFKYIIINVNYLNTKQSILIRPKDTLLNSVMIYQYGLTSSPKLRFLCYKISKKTDTSYKITSVIEIENNTTTGSNEEVTTLYITSVVGLK